MTRIRKKKNLIARMSACASYVFDVPTANRGRWKEACKMSVDAPLFLELGCGRGQFIVTAAKRQPEICFIALEKEESVIISAMERACAEGLKNVFFLCADAWLICNYFAPEEIDRIYINFCDPWSRKNKPKRRLTYRGYLEKYKVLLRPEGEIHFKTDDDRLFAFSLAEFGAAGFDIRNKTMDLHRSSWDAQNIRTEFEDRFTEQGIPIKRVEAVKRK